MASFEDWSTRTRMSLAACVPGSVAVGAPVEWNSVPTDAIVGRVGLWARSWATVSFLVVPLSLTGISWVVADALTAESAEIFVSATDQPQLSDAKRLQRQEQDARGVPDDRERPRRHAVGAAEVVVRHRLVGDARWRG